MSHCISKTWIVWSKHCSPQFNRVLIITRNCWLTELYYYVALLLITMLLLLLLALLSSLSSSLSSFTSIKCGLLLLLRLQVPSVPKNHPTHPENASFHFLAARTGDQKTGKPNAAWTFSDSDSWPVRTGLSGKPKLLGGPRMSAQQRHLGTGTGVH